MCRGAGAAKRESEGLFAGILGVADGAAANFAEASKADEQLGKTWSRCDVLGRELKEAVLKTSNALSRFNCAAIITLKHAHALQLARQELPTGEGAIEGADESAGESGASSSGEDEGDEEDEEGE